MANDPNPLGMFSGFQGGTGNAKMGFKDNKFTLGKYLVKFDGVEAKFSPRYKNFVMVSMTVLAVLETPASDAPKNLTFGGPNQPGTIVTYNMWESSDSFERELVTLVCNVLGCGESDVTEAVLLELVSESQPMRGYVAEVECMHRWRKDDIQENGIPKPEAKAYSKCHFFPAWDADQIAEVLGQEDFEKYIGVPEPSA